MNSLQLNPSWRYSATISTIALVIELWAAALAKFNSQQPNKIAYLAKLNS